MAASVAQKKLFKKLVSSLLIGFDIGIGKNTNSGEIQILFLKHNDYNYAF
jgi:hypothetical protein